MNYKEYFETLSITVVDADATKKSKEDKEAFCLTRRQGIGGSESATVLGVSKWKSLDELIEQKCSNVITKEELEVGEKASVRKGADIEPIILHKFEEWSNKEIEKPEEMYRIDSCPALTVNFDGVYYEPVLNQIIPVECKLVTQFGQKYWSTLHEAKGFSNVCQHPLFAGRNIQEHIIELSKMYGIPEYYFTQVQHQLIATGADYAWLVALFDKDWELHAFKIYKDEWTQNELKERASVVWESITEMKGIRDEL